MSKLQKVTLEFDDKIYVAEGEDAENWDSRVAALEGLGFAHGCKGDFHWTKVLDKSKLLVLVDGEWCEASKDFKETVKDITENLEKK